MRRLRSGEAMVFAVTTLLLLVHALDDAFLHRQPGVGLGHHALGAALTLGAGIAAAVGFALVRPGLRAALAFGFGVLALVNGMMHVIHIRDSGAAASDLTGALAAVAGAVLVGLSVAIAWRHRGKGAATAGRRWALRVLAVPAGLGLALVLLPVGMGIVEVHKFRKPVGAPPSAAYAEVGFRSADGLDMAGWYRPSENGAAILVLHGGGSDRRGSVAHAEMLARHGYGVLLYDARGRGESEGSQNSYGWDWAKDVAGALEFLEARDDVDPGRIGAFGISTGADVLLEVAARGTGIDALVTDGAAAGSFADWQRLQGTTVMTPFFWTEFAAIRVLSGNAPGPALIDLVPDISAPLLLISAGRDPERDFNVAYEAAAQEAAEHWNLPNAHHTRGLREQPEEYERRVSAFFDSALL
jgi:alpha-beta hydrolase superfamily lysophospholipase